MAKISRRLFPLCFIGAPDFDEDDFDMANVSPAARRAPVTALPPEAQPETETAVHDEQQMYEVRYFVRDDEGRFHSRVERVVACDEYDAWLEVVTLEADRQARAWWCLSVRVTPNNNSLTPENDN